MEKVLFKTAQEILSLIHTQKISCEALAQQVLEHIKRYNPSINAISDLRPPEEILEEARQKDAAIKKGDPLGALHGLPMTVKDTFNVKGLLTTNGNPSLKNNIAQSDAELVKRLKAAGAIIIGKTNLALFALDWQSTNKWFGQTNNPYGLDYVVGGSSGGSAAAVAAGFSPLELGTDAGGSIRVPAHFCGVCGLRTTESALPMRGNMETPNMIRTGRYLTVNGPFARNIDDLILITKVLWNADSSFAENPPVPFNSSPKSVPSNLKIAYSKTIDQIPLEEEYRIIYEGFLKKLETPTFSLAEQAPKMDTQRLTKLWGKIAGFDFGAALKRIPLKRLLVYSFIRSKYKDKLWAQGMSKGAVSTPAAYAKSLIEKDDLADHFSAFFDQYDAWITPVSAAAAFKHQKTGKPFMINGRKLPYTQAFVPFNFPSTIPGHPIVVIPIGKTKAGLPVGIQIHGKKWCDGQLLQIAKRLEAFTDGFTTPDLLNPSA